MAKSQILQFISQGGKPQPIADGNINAQRFVCDLPSFIGLRNSRQSAHVVQAVGQFNKNNPPILGGGSISLRKFSASRSCLSMPTKRSIFDKPSTSRAISPPKVSLICASVTGVSSTTSCNKAAMRVGLSNANRQECRRRSKDEE